jgi:16S rRNA processing protein RimM
VKPQGRRGEVSAELLTDFPERFAERSHLWLRGPGDAVREMELEEFWPHKGRIVLKFRGVDSISDAELLAGCEVQVPLADRTPLEPGAAYISDLVGCVVSVDENGAQREIGTVGDVVFGAGEAPLLVVRQGEIEHMVPMVERFIETLDLAGKRLLMKLPDGLLEINAPLSKEEKQRQRK